jgi:hypothetical protein
MSEWWTYSLEDVLMFRPRVYWRMFELENEALWPLHVPALLLGAAILVLVLRPAPWSGRAIGIALGVVWIWVAWSFLWGRYATINWTVAYVAPAFALQGIGLLWAGARGVWVPAFARSSATMIALGLYLYALVLHPLVAVVAGRPEQAAEVFGVAPDPTAIATLGLVAMAQGRTAWLLLVIPVAWCLVSAVTLYAMGSLQALIPLAAAGLAVAARGSSDR